MIAAAQAGGGVLCALATGLIGGAFSAALAALGGAVAVALPQWHFARRARILIANGGGARGGLFFSLPLFKFALTVFLLAAVFRAAGEYASAFAAAGGAVAAVCGGLIFTVAHGARAGGSAP
jgi:hypothetical protein